MMWEVFMPRKLSDRSSGSLGATRFNHASPPKNKEKLWKTVKNEIEGG